MLARIFILSVLLIPLTACGVFPQTGGSELLMTLLLKLEGDFNPYNRNAEAQLCHIHFFAANDGEEFAVYPHLPGRDIEESDLPPSEFQHESTTAIAFAVNRSVDDYKIKRIPCQIEADITLRGFNDGALVTLFFTWNGGHSGYKRLGSFVAESGTQQLYLFSQTRESVGMLLSREPSPESLTAVRKLQEAVADKQIASTGSDGNIELTIENIEIYPQLPSDFKRGWCTVRYNVNGAGIPENIAIKECEPAGFFETKSVETVRDTFRFQPKIVNGRGVTVEGVESKFVYMRKAKHENGHASSKGEETAQ